MSDKSNVIYIRAEAELRERVQRFANARSISGPIWTMSDAARYLLTRSLDELERKR